MISAHHNYDNGYIALVNLRLKNLPDTISVEGYTLLLKKEFHVSLICAKKIAVLIDPENNRKIEAEIVELFKEFIKHQPLSDFSLNTELRFVELDQRKTVIVMTHVPGLDQFFNMLEKHYGNKLPLQPTHITLYTLQPEVGIGILSKGELEKLSTIVVVPELTNLEYSTTARAAQ